MASPRDISFRDGNTRDVDQVAALATYVYLDTYAPSGIRAVLAREVFAEFSSPAFAGRMAMENRFFMLAESDAHLVGFAEFARGVPCPVLSVAAGTELVRLYVHPRWHGRGIGRELLHLAERAVASTPTPGLWLTAWTGNQAALAFYKHIGYTVVGGAAHFIDGTAYPNHVLAR